MPIPKILKPPMGIAMSGRHRSHKRYRDMVGHWMFGESGGSIVRDISGFRRDVVLTNTDPTTAWGPGPFGPTLGFDGVGDHLLYNTSADFFTPTAFTVAAWVYWTALSGFDRIFTTEANEISLLTNGTTLRYQINDAGHTHDFGISVSTGVWTHVALTFNAGSNVVRAYKNGIPGTDDVNTATVGGIQDVLLGANVPLSQMFVGRMSEVRFQGCDLNANEIMSFITNPFLEFERPRLFVKAPAVVGGATWPGYQSASGWF